MDEYLGFYGKFKHTNNGYIMSEIVWKFISNTNGVYKYKTLLI